MSDIVGYAACECSKTPFTWPQILQDKLCSVSFCHFALFHSCFVENDEYSYTPRWPNNSPILHGCYVPFQGPGLLLEGGNRR